MAAALRTMLLCLLGAVPTTIGAAPCPAAKGDPVLSRIALAKRVSNAPGNRATLVGRDFGKSPGTVRFGAAVAGIKKWSSRKIALTGIPDGAGLVDVRVTTADQLDTGTLPFTYAPPQLSNVVGIGRNPCAITLRLDGYGFGQIGHGPATHLMVGTIQVSFGNSAIRKWNDHQIRLELARLPRPTVAKVDFEVVTSAGQSDRPDFPYPFCPSK